MILLIICIFFVIVGSSYEPDYHNRILFVLDGDAWMEERCTITTHNGRYVGVNEQNQIIHQIFPDNNTEWWYVYNNTNTRIGTFRNDSNQNYISFTTDVIGETLSVDQSTIDLSKNFTTNTNSAGKSTIISPLGLFVTEGNTEDSPFTLEEFDEIKSQFLILRY